MSDFSQLLKDLRENIVSLDPKQQQELADVIRQAYAGNDVFIGERLVVQSAPGRPVSTWAANFENFTGISTVGQAEDTLLRSLLPTAIEAARAEKTSIFSFGDAVNEAVISVDKILRGQGAKAFDPTKGTFLPFAANVIGQSMKEIKRSDAYHGRMSETAQAQATADFFARNQGSESEILDPGMIGIGIENSIPEGFSVIRGRGGNQLQSDTPWMDVISNYARETGSEIPVGLYVPGGTRLITPSGINKEFSTANPSGSQFIDTNIPGQPWDSMKVVPNSNYKPGYIQANVSQADMEMFLKNRNNPSPEWEGSAVVQKSLEQFASGLERSGVGGNPLSSNLQDFDAEIFTKAHTNVLADQASITQSLLDDSFALWNESRKVSVKVKNWLAANPTGDVPVELFRKDISGYPVDRTAVEEFLQRNAKKLFTSTDAEILPDGWNPAQSANYVRRHTIDGVQVPQEFPTSERIDQPDYILDRPTVMSGSVTGNPTLPSGTLPLKPVYGKDGQVVPGSTEGFWQKDYSTPDETDEIEQWRALNRSLRGDPNLDRQVKMAREVAAKGTLQPNFYDRYHYSPVVNGVDPENVPEEPPLPEEYTTTPDGMSDYVRVKVNGAKLTKEEKKKIADQVHETVQKVTDQVKANIPSAASAEIPASQAVSAEPVVSDVENVGPDIRARRQAELEAASRTLEKYPEYLEKHAGKGASNAAAWNEWLAGLEPEQRAEVLAAHKVLTDELVDMRKLKVDQKNSEYAKMLERNGIEKVWSEENVDGAHPEDIPAPRKPKPNKYNKIDINVPLEDAIAARNLANSDVPQPLADDAYWASLGATEPSSPEARNRQAAEARISEVGISSGVGASSNMGGGGGSIRSVGGQFVADPAWIAANTAAWEEHIARINGAPSANMQQLHEATRAAQYQEIASNLSARNVDAFESQIGSRRTEDGVSFYANRAGQITISPEHTQLAEQMARSSALDAAPLASDSRFNDDEKFANVNHAFNKGIKERGEQLYKALTDESSSPEVKAVAEQIVKRVTEAAGQIAKPITEFMAEASGKSYDVSSSSIYAGNVRELSEQLKSSPKFARRFDEVFGEGASANEDLLKQISKGERNYLQAGNNSWAIGGGDEGNWGGGGAGGGTASGKPRPLRQTDFGRLMMGTFVVGQALAMTSDTVIKDMEDYTKVEGGAALAQAYSGGYVTPAASQTLRQAEAAYRSGELAYQKFGAFTDAFTGMSGTPAGDALTSMGQSVKMGLGAAAIVGGGAYMAGALGVGGATGIAAGAALAGAAAPLAIAAGVAVAAPFLAMDTANAIAGQDASQGWSFGNFNRAREANIYNISQGGSGMVGGFYPTGASVDEWLASSGASAEDIIRTNHPNYSEAQVRQAAAKLSGGSTLGASANLAIDTIAEAQGDVFGRSDIHKGVATAQHFLGSMSDARNSSTIARMFENARVLGTTIDQQFTGLNQIASYRGIQSGTPEASAMGAQWSGYSTAQQQEQAVSQSALAYQSYAQFTPYLGSVSAAYAQYQGMQYQTPAGTQAATSMLSGMSMAGEDPNKVIGHELAFSLSAAGGPGAVMSPITQAHANQQALNGLIPAQQLQVTAAANMASQYGAMGFSQGIEKFSGLLQSGAISAPQLSALTSFDKQAWSDLSRSGAVTGVPQIMDANGFQAGERSMSGIFNWASQSPTSQMIQNVMGASGGGLLGSAITSNILAGGGNAALNAMGIYRGDTQMQNAMLRTDGTGGMAGGAALQLHNDRMFGFSMASIGIGFAQIANQENYLWGGSSGGTAQAPTAGSLWGLQDQIRSVQWQGQLDSFAYTTKRMDLSNKYARENATAQHAEWQENVDYSRQMSSFDFGTSLMQRGNTRQQWQFQSQMSNLNFGWQQEDLTEQIRNASGRDRARLLEQRDRTTLAHNLDEGNTDKQRTAQEKLWKREDERYALEVQHNEKLIKMNEEDYKRQTEQRETLFKMDKDDLKRRIEEATKLNDLNEQMITLQRKNQEDSINFQKASLGNQAAAAIEAKKWQEANQATNISQQNMMSAWDRLSRQAPGIISMIDKLANIKIHFTVSADYISVDGGGDGMP
jgi:hypothetical protein